MDPNGSNHKLPPSQIPMQQIYPILSQLTPLPIKHENPGIPSIKLQASASFSHQNGLKRHIEIVHEEKSRQKSVSKSSNLGNNQIYPILSQLKPLPKNHIKQENSEIPSIKTENEGQKSQCPSCSASYAHKSDLKRHIENVHEGKNPQCTICLASFSRKNDLKRHIESIHEGKKTKCTICPALFCRKTDMKRHIETVHEGKSRYHIKQENSRIPNIKTDHEGQKSQCPRCSASYARKSDLKRHIENVHEGKNPQCTICLASFSRKNDRKRHIENVHEGKSKETSAENSSNTNLQEIKEILDYIKS